MKYMMYWIVVVLFSLSCNAYSETKLGLVDMRSALFSSESAKQFTDKMVSEFKDQEDAIIRVTEEGKKLETRLQTDGPIMSDAERAKMAADLEEKAQEFKYLKSKFDNAIAQRRQEFLADSKPKLDAVIAELVEEEGLDLLIPIEAALHYDPKLDYTSKFIDKLNKLK